MIPDIGYCTISMVFGKGNYSIRFEFRYFSVSKRSSECQLTFKCRDINSWKILELFIENRCGWKMGWFQDHETG